MKSDFSRRDFLARFARGAAAGVSLPALARAVGAKQPLPQRVLGRTGVQVSILAFGCGSRFLMYEDEDEALAALERAIDRGINYLDTAYAYGDGKSETRVGRLMATRRKQVFLATKIPDRRRDDFLRRLEASLKRLQVDQVDLVHIHSLRRADDLARLEAPDGALQGLLEAREQKMARFIGMTSHTDGDVMAQAIDRHDLDVVQMALNPTLAGRLEEVALPAARRKNIGVIAMKVYGQDFLLEGEASKTDPGSLLRYSLSLPVATAVVGMPKLEHISHNIDVARSFTPLAEAELQRLREVMAPAREAMEKRLTSHLDGPTHTPAMFFA